MKKQVGPLVKLKRCLALMLVLMLAVGLISCSTQGPEMEQSDDLNGYYFKGLDEFEKEIYLQLEENFLKIPVGEFAELPLEYMEDEVQGYPDIHVKRACDAFLLDNPEVWVAYNPYHVTVVHMATGDPLKYQYWIFSEDRKEVEEEKLQLLQASAETILSADTIQEAIEGLPILDVYGGGYAHSLKMAFPNDVLLVMVQKKGEEAQIWALFEFNGVKHIVDNCIGVIDTVEKP